MSSNSKLKRQSGPWSYADVQKVVPYVRLLLATLREHYIAAWHYFRLNGYDATGSAYQTEIKFHRNEGIAALEELEDLGVIVFQNPLRRIGLFTFSVTEELDDHSTIERIAYWVCMDSRESIESFAFAEDIYNNQLIGVERPVRPKWKTSESGRLFVGLV